MELEEWEAVIETNLDGVMHGTKAAIPHLEGVRTAVSSTSGQSTDWSAAKGAASSLGGERGVVNFTQQVAVDYADSGVRVNSICRGFVKNTDDGRPTESNGSITCSSSERRWIATANPRRSRPWRRSSPLTRRHCITGANIPIDGGGRRSVSVEANVVDDHRSPSSSSDTHRYNGDGTQ